MSVACAAGFCGRFLWEGDTSNKLFEWTGLHQPSARLPQAPCLSLSGSVSRQRPNIKICKAIILEPRSSGNDRKTMGRLQLGLFKWHSVLVVCLATFPLSIGHVLAQGNSSPADCAAKSRGFGYSNDQIIELCKNGGSAQTADCAVKSRGFGYSNDQIIKLCANDAKSH